MPSKIMKCIKSKKQEANDLVGDLNPIKIIETIIIKK